MAMNRSDIARAMYVGQNEYFFKVLDKPRRLEYKQYSSPKKSTKKEETYDTIGNLPPEQIKEEEAAVKYGKITEAHQTTVRNRTHVNGFFVSLETKQDEQYGIVDKVQTTELARTMLIGEEKEVAAVIDASFSTVGADGVAACAANHPLIGSAKVNNNLLAAGAPTPDIFITASNMFNSIYNHAGDNMDTEATAGLFHKNYQATVTAILQSTLKAQESSNTKNTVPSLKMIFSKFIAQLPYYFLDEEIESVIFQRRTGMQTQYDYDKRSTFNFYYNAFQRYRAAFIHPGFGILGVTGS